MTRAWLPAGQEPQPVHQCQVFWVHRCNLQGRASWVACSDSTVWRFAMVGRSDGNSHRAIPPTGYMHSSCKVL